MYYTIPMTMFVPTMYILDCTVLALYITELGIKRLAVGDTSDESTYKRHDNKRAFGQNSK